MNDAEQRPSLVSVPRPPAAVAVRVRSVWCAVLLPFLTVTSSLAADPEPAPSSSPLPVMVPDAPAAATSPPVRAPEATPPAAPSPTIAPVAPVAPVAPQPRKNPLGASPRDIVRLFGPVLKHNARVRNHQVLEGGTVLDGDLHGRGGLIIRVVYHEGRSVLLEFTRGGGPLLLADVNLMLSATAEDSTWVPGKDSSDAVKYYRRADNRAIATYTTENDGSLLIATEGPEHDHFYDNIMH